MSDTIAERFHALFAGNERFYGTYNKIGLTERGDGKLLGDPKTVRAPVTRSLYDQHLAGVNGLGIAPIREDNTCVFGAIDIDVYAELDHTILAHGLKQRAIPLIVCRSKSGGAHLYLFSREPVEAALMQGKLREIAGKIGHGKAEVFPKQVRIDPDPRKCASWINLPYYAADEGSRYAVKPEGIPYSLSEFLDHAELMRVPSEFFKRGDPLPDGPPCLNSLIQIKFPIGTQDNGMFNLGIYAKKAHPENWAAALGEMNERYFDPPIGSDDMRRIIGSLGRTEYKYQCNGDPLSQYCNSKACARRKFGVGDGSAVDEGGLTKSLASAITTNDHFARDAGGRLYDFSGGVYRPTGERLIERRVKELCLVWDKTKAWSPELATRVCEWIRVDAPELWESPPLDTLNCRNGLLDVQTRELRAHEPEHLSAVQIAVSFDPEATCPHIDRFIQDVFPTDSRHLPFEMAAWLMRADTSIQKSALLVGEGATGKSVFLNLLLTFLGKDNVATISLHRLESDKFSVARLVGKLANVGADLPTTALAGTSIFKSLTGGDVVTAERKYEASFEFRPFARLLFSANSAPRSGDSSHGFFRRWLVIPFNRTFDEKDPNTVPRALLDARLAEPGELSGLLNRALDALPAIRAGRFSESASTLAALAEFQATTDPMAVWLDQNSVERADAFVTKDELRRAYGRVCQDNGRPIMNDVQFTAALKRLRPKVEPKRKSVDGRQVQVFVGLGFLTKDPEPGGMF